MGERYRRKIVQDISLEHTSIISSDTLSSGSNESLTLTPPDGYIYEIQNMRVLILAPPSASSGQHYVLMYPMTVNIPVIRLWSQYNKAIKYVYGHVEAADNYNPDNNEAFNDMVRNLVATKDYPLLIKYFNDTDVDQTNQREFYFVYLKRRI